MGVDGTNMKNINTNLKEIKYHLNCTHVATDTVQQQVIVDTVKSGNTVPIYRLYHSISFEEFPPSQDVLMQKSSITVLYCNNFKICFK